MTNEKETAPELTKEEIERILEEDERYFIRKGTNAGIYD